MMIHPDEPPLGPERIPSRAVVALFVMGSINTCHHIFMGPMAFFQAHTLKMGTAAAKGHPKIQLSAHPQLMMTLS